ncbi:unnamed protein product [Acanthoscelides obtectus]|uniref:Uncharacterized protein n=1 Tax=Acanthoscelides obtectus TaxID=200917 RepID=A0A9P0MCE2_ACAOB|nr:unnamed protein product [Acanthoscelides obtectus]CAK1659015.1 Alcohol dehydrogenase 2 [Acanthoscelides obtectus]
MYSCSLNVLSHTHTHRTESLISGFTLHIEIFKIHMQTHFVLLGRSFGSPYFYDLTGIRFLTMCPGVTDTPLISDANKFTLNGFPGLGQNLAEGLGDLPPQPTTNVAIGLIKMIKDGENGSVWVSEGNQPIYEVEIPDRLTLRKK